MGKKHRRFPLTVFLLCDQGLWSALSGPCVGVCVEQDNAYEPARGVVVVVVRDGCVSWVSEAWSPEPGGERGCSRK